MKGNIKRNRYKFLVIMLTLVIPVVVYLFLRGFGENHFTVPVFYEKGVPPDSTLCHTNGQPHIVNLQMALADQDIKPFDHPYEKKLSIIDVDENPQNRPGIPGYPINRVADIFAGNPKVQFILIRPAGLTGSVKQSPPEDRFLYVNSTREKMSEFAKCELILLDFPEHVDSLTRRLVVVDSQGRIRGYYQAGDFDEIDRMILEMKIMLTEEY